MFLAVCVVLLAIFVGSITSLRFQRWQITVPLAMVAAGVVCGWQSSAPILDRLTSSNVERIVEIVLSVLLFLDATEVRSGWRETLGPLVRLVLIGVPLSLFFAVIAAIWIWPSQRVPFFLMLACVAIPTDMAPASRLLADDRIPQRLRDLLNTESGYNDGIVSPVFVVAETILKNKNDGGPLHSLISLVTTAAGSLAVGLIIGALAGMALKQCIARGWATGAQTSVAVLAIPLFAYSAAVGLGLNGFLAAFVTGLSFRAVRGEAIHQELVLTRGVSSFASMALWFILGQLAQYVWSSTFHWKAFLFSMLCLTVLRVIPVMLALTPSSITFSHRLLIGWAGPRGIASIVFALLALPALTSGQQDVVLEVLVATVVSSVVLHGLSAPLVARSFSNTTDSEGLR